MRYDKITFADITKIYNRLKFKGLATSTIQQTVISRKIRKIITNINDEKFGKFLKDRNLDEEFLFFYEAINPILESRTKFTYKTFCLVIIFLLVEESSKDNLVRNIMKNNIKENAYIEFIFDNNTIELNDDINEVKKIALDMCKNNKKSKKHLKDIEKCLNQGIKISINILLEYSNFEEEKSSFINSELKVLFLKILNMNYKSKCKLKIRLEHELKKEYYRFNKNENNSDMDKAINNVAIRDNIDYIKVSELQNEKEYSFLKACELINGE